MLRTLQLIKVELYISLHKYHNDLHYVIITILGIAGKRRIEEYFSKEDKSRQKIQIRNSSHSRESLQVGGF